MKNLHWARLWTPLMLMGLVTLPVAAAQMGSGRGRRARMYNPATETTVTGMVEEVKTVAGRRGWHGTHLMLKTQDKTIDVHLGPESFLKSKGFDFAKGDQVEITGSATRYKGGEAIIAREVKKGGKTLVLRNAQGVPQWSRRGRR